MQTIKPLNVYFCSFKALTSQWHLGGNSVVALVNYLEQTGSDQIEPKKKEV